jgi:hypothetical protein
MSDSAKAGLGPETLSLIRELVSGEAVTLPRGPLVHRIVSPQEALPARRGVSDVVTQRFARLRALRPSRRQSVWAAVGLIVLLRPAWVVLTLVLGVFVMLGMVVAFGADRVWSGSVGLLKWYTGRAPERGVRLAARIDRFACRWDSLLDRFPDGWVDGLYLPDLQSLLDAEDWHDAVMATRLQRMHDQLPDHETAV